MPGERELKLEQERRRTGIPLSIAVLDQIIAAGDGFGVTAPRP